MIDFKPSKLLSKILNNRLNNLTISLLQPQRASPNSLVRLPGLDCSTASTSSEVRILDPTSKGRSIETGTFSFLATPKPSSGGFFNPEGAPQFWFVLALMKRLDFALSWLWRNAWM